MFSRQGALSNLRVETRPAPPVYRPQAGTSANAIMFKPAIPAQAQPNFANHYPPPFQARPQGRQTSEGVRPAVAQRSISVTPKPLPLSLVRPAMGVTFAPSPLRIQSPPVQPKPSVTFPPRYVPMRSHASAGAKTSCASQHSSSLTKGKQPCCAECARHGAPTVTVQPAMRGWNTVQRSAKEEYKKEVGVPKKKSGKEQWAQRASKSQKKEKAGKRAAVKVAVGVAEKIKSCEETVGFAGTFNTHVLTGEPSGTTHTGYHSENTTNHAAFGACVSTGAADGNGVYKASCTKTGKTVAKESTFFPVGWNIERIRTETAYAYCHRVDKAGIDGAAALAWVGNINGDAFMIGGTDASPLSTSFPSYNGGFS